MSKLALGLILAVGVAALPATGSAKTARTQTTEKADTGEKAQANLSKEEQAKLREHVKMRNHILKGVKYPASKDELVSQFKGFKDIKTDDRKWFEETLPNKTYDSPEDVMKALGWEVNPEETGATHAKSSK
jgi:hypothetical protein